MMVRGVSVDGETRCTHYQSPVDIIAIKMHCCGEYYACFSCHEALAGHEATVWPRSDWDQPAVLCGACGTELSIRQYLGCSDRCPTCRVNFNPGCRKHYHLYFDAP